MGSYLDPDGLYRKYGLKKAVPQTGGEYKAYGGLRMLELGLDLTLLNRNGDLPVLQTLATNYIQEDQLFIPIQGTGTTDKPRYVYAEIEVVTAAVGATATLDLGAIATDRTSVLSQTAFLSAYPVASLTPIGTRQTIVVGSTGAGAWIGRSPVDVSGPFTAVQNSAYFIARNNTALFTAGYIIVRIYYTMQNTLQ